MKTKPKGTKLSFTFSTEDMRILKVLKASLIRAQGSGSYVAAIRKAIREVETA